eukprot:SAG31_NODE_33225_length_346_cov_1.020243_1_plen_104_part_01
MVTSTLAETILRLVEVYLRQQAASRSKDRISLLLDDPVVVVQRREQVFAVRAVSIASVRVANEQLFDKRGISCSNLLLDFGSRKRELLVARDAPKNRAIESVHC